jgi:hypothetical protein
MTDRVTMSNGKVENTENYEGLDKAKAILTLDRLVIRRVIRSYEFNSPTDYILRTHLLIQNTDEYDCSIVPGELYKRGVPIELKAYDSNNTEGVLIPSDENSIFIVKYIFFKIIKNLDKSELENKLDIKKVLCYQFSNKEEYLDREGILDNDIDDILNNELKGPLAIEFFDSILRGTKKMSHHLDKRFVDCIPIKYKKMQKNFGDLKFRDICSSEIIQFINRFDKGVFQLILLKTPISHLEYSTVTLEKEHTRRGQKKWHRISEEINLPLDIHPLLPGQEGSTFHYRFKRPEGVRIRLRNYLRHKFKPPKSFLSMGGKILNPECFDILHTSSPSERCTTMLELLNIFEVPATRFVTPRNVSTLERKETPENAQIAPSLISLYFGNHRDRHGALCNEDHEIKISLGLERADICFFHYLLMLFLASMIFLSFLWLFKTLGTPYLEIPNSFWTFSFFVVIQSASAIFDYSRRNDAQRYFMRTNMRVILCLVIIATFLLLTVVALPLILM